VNSPIGRDFKRSGRPRPLALELPSGFFAGLGIGLLVAAAVFLWQQQLLRRATEAAESRPPQPRAVPRDAPPTEAVEPPRDYGFYEMLPQAEVIVPETNPKTAAPALPNTPIVRPGTYVLQPGFFRNRDEAEQMQAKLLRLGVNSAVQRVAIDNEVFHRVRIGPADDLVAINRTRDILQRAEIDTLVVRVGD